MSRAFNFKEFTVQQDRSPMKVGTDGVLLGAWCTCSKAERILDIGTGTGLIALMLAQRNAVATIIGLEPNQEAYADANLNFANSPWAQRLLAVNQSLEDFRISEEFDLIVSNPPYFINSLPSSEQGSVEARHVAKLGPENLAASAQFLSKQGIISGIYPQIVYPIFEESAKSQGLFLRRLCKVQPTPDKAAHRILFEFGREPGKACETSELVIEDKGRHGYSDAYKSLTKDFYLAF